MRGSVPIRTGAPQITANCSNHHGTCSEVVTRNTVVLKSTECNGIVETKALRPIAGYFNLLSIFRRVRIIAEASITFISSPSIRMHQRGPNRRTPVKFYAGDFYENVEKLSNLVKIGQKYRALYVMA